MTESSDCNSSPSSSPTNKSPSCCSHKSNSNCNKQENLSDSCYSFIPSESDSDSNNICFNNDDTSSSYNKKK